MEYHGGRQIATYMTGPHVTGRAVHTFLPAVGNVQGSWKAYDTYPAPAPLRRSLTAIPWSPSVYYSTSMVNSSLAGEKKLPNPLSYHNHMSQLDNIKVPPLFAAARQALYTRYTPGDWVQHKKNISADNVRAIGEKMRLETNRLANELDERTRNTKADVGKKLGDRINDIDFWKAELTHETDQLMDETAKLKDAAKALESFIKDSDNQLHIAKESLYNREKRQGIDLVHDAPEQALLTEVDLIRRCQEMARTHLNKANCQLNMNRAAQHELEKDTKDKHVAAIIDSVSYNLTDTSRGLHLHRGIERVDNTVSVPESWAEFTNNNITRSQAERGASKDMRNDIQNMLNQASDQLWKQWNKVNTDLTGRIRETMEARNKIQHHLSGTLQEIFDTEKNIEFIKKAVNDKLNPLKVATTRLENRLHRPNMEACRDAAQNRLVQEVYELDESLETLTSQMRRAEDQLQALLAKRSALEHDLAVKNNTIHIDMERCMAMRRTYPMQQKVWRLM